MIMKRLLSILVIFGVFVSLYAQSGIIEVRNVKDQGDRLLTMEEAVLGIGIIPQSKTFQWRGNLPEIITVAKDTIFSQKVSKKCKVGAPEPLLTLKTLNSDIGTSMKRMPNFTWIDGNNIEWVYGGKLFRYDIAGHKLIFSFKLPENAVSFTPSENIDSEGQMYAYTRGNNLFVCDRNGVETAVTSDTDKNIINGQTVSRNEFGINGGIFWSPDGSLLAFYRKDESAVGTFPLLDITTRTGSLREIKYPMAGMDSENISLGVYNPASGKTIFLNVTDFDKERYLTNISWTPDSRHILIQVLDRSQKNMHLNMYSALDGSFEKKLFEEHNDKFVEPSDPLIFLETPIKRYKSPHFIYRTDNRDGYKNLYLCDLDGNVTRLTATDADVSYAGQRGTRIFYYSAEVTPIDNHLFSIDLKNGKVVRHTTAEGWHTCMLSGDGDYFIDRYNSLNVPRIIQLCNTTNSESANLFTADDPVHKFDYGEITLGTVKSADGLYDNYYRLIKPADFDPSKKYPVIVYVYGGPHSQMVQNTFLGQYRPWEMLMAQKGYIVYVQDNRGTSNRGAAFEKAIYGECGQAEMADQMEGVRMLSTLPYVDTSRIGLHGWSYGGFMTISLMLNHPDVFKVAVAGGPVIDWRWYEVMYGERYMGSPETNAAGYDKVSLIPRAKDLKGKLLICQGAIDNTVVWEHSLSFINECIRNLVQVDYFPYPCHEHNVRGRERIHLMDKVTMYFEDYLK